MKKINNSNKKQYKLLFFVSIFVLTLSSALVTINASGISYEENDTYYNFDVNENFPYWVSENYSDQFTDFTYIVTLPIEFYIEDFRYYNLTINIDNGLTLYAEALSSLGTPYYVYFTNGGLWDETLIDTTILLEYGITINQTNLDILYNFNFEYDDNRSFENVADRWLKYQLINQLLHIKLSSFRLDTNVQVAYSDNITKFYNISPIYVDDSSYSNYILSGIALGYNVKNSSGERIPLDIPKFSFDSNNEKYNEYTVFIEKAKYVSARDEFYVSYNNLDVVGSVEEGYSENVWLNYNYKYIVINSDIGILDYLNLSLIGDFNVSQYWFDPDTNATFNDLFTGIANVPIVVLSNLLSFSIFGWQAFAVLCGIITLLVIIWLIRKLTR